MNKRISLGAAIAYMAIAAAITFSITKIYTMKSFNSMMENINERESSFEKIAEVDRIIRDNYYGSIDQKALDNSTINGMVYGLDDHNSYYMTPSEYESFVNSDTGRYVGIGVEVEKSDDGYIKVVDVFPESSAELSGVNVGDIIVSVDDVPVNNDNYAELAGSLIGEAGTKVKLERRINKEQDILNIVRRDIDIPTLEYKMIDDGVGYIDFKDIKVGTARQLDKAIRNLQTEKATSLVLDLRDIYCDNEEYVVSILQTLLPQGNIGNRVYKNGKAVSIGKATTKGVTIPITLIVNDKTSGTVEFLAEAMHELPNCKIVGARTAGNGLAHELIRISDGSAVMLTTSIYETDSGVRYNEKGVIPDFEVIMDVDENKKESIYGNLEVDIQLKKARDISLAFARANETITNTEG